MAVSTRTPGPLGTTQRVIGPGVGSEGPGRVLGRDPDLDRVPAGIGRLLGGTQHRRGEGPAGRDRQLLPDDVDARDELGHPVLDLEAGVDLEEPEVAGLVEEELGRRRVPQARGTGGPQAQLVQVAALVGGEARRGRLLDQLLVPALDRAVALAEGDDRPERVAEELDLDMAGGPDLAFEVDGAVPEGGERLGRRGRERRRQLHRRGDPAHAPPSPAGRGLDEQAGSRRAPPRRGRPRAGPAGRRRPAPACPARPARRPRRPPDAQRACRRGQGSSPTTDRRRPARPPPRPGRTRSRRARGADREVGPAQAEGGRADQEREGGRDQRPAAIAIDTGVPPIQSVRAVRAPRPKKAACQVHLPRVARDDVPALGQLIESTPAARSSGRRSRGTRRGRGARRARPPRMRRRNRFRCRYRGFSFSSALSWKTSRSVWPLRASAHRVRRTTASPSLPAAEQALGPKHEDDEEDHEPATSRYGPPKAAALRASATPTKIRPRRCRASSRGRASTTTIRAFSVHSRPMDGLIE